MHPVWPLFGKAQFCIAQSDLIEIPHSGLKAKIFVPCDVSVLIFITSIRVPATGFRTE